MTDEMSTDEALSLVIAAARKSQAQMYSDASVAPEQPEELDHAIEIVNTEL